MKRARSVSPDGAVQSPEPENTLALVLKTYKYAIQGTEAQQFDIFQEHHVVEAANIMSTGTSALRTGGTPAAYHIGVCLLKVFVRKPELCGVFPLKSVFEGLSDKWVAIGSTAFLLVLAQIFQVCLASLVDKAIAFDTYLIITSMYDRLRQHDSSIPPSFVQQDPTTASAMRLMLLRGRGDVDAWAYDKLKDLFLQVRPVDGDPDKPMLLLLFFSALDGAPAASTVEMIHYCISVLKTSRRSPETAETALAALKFMVFRSPRNLSVTTSTINAIVDTMHMALHDVVDDVMWILNNIFVCASMQELQLVLEKTRALEMAMKAAEWLCVIDFVTDTDTQPNVHRNAATLTATGMFFRRVAQLHGVAPDKKTHMARLLRDLLKDSESGSRRLVTHVHTVIARTVSVKGTFEWPSISIPAFKALKREIFSSPVCAICLESFKDGDETTSAGCAHTFHSACIGRWLSQSPTCPNCRVSLADVNVV